MSSLSSLLTDLVAQAASAAGFDPASVPPEAVVPTTDRAHGDYQSNLAFRLAKVARTNPRKLAEQMIAHMPAFDAIASVEVAGPGFLNLRLSDAWLADELVRTAADAHLGVAQVGQGQRVVIDYSSPNIAKRMHVGHLRSTLIGDALARLYRGLGFEVIADNHLGDWGTPFGMLMVAWALWRDEAAYARDPVPELERLYQHFRTVAADDPALLDQARAMTARLQAGDAEVHALWAQFVAASMAEFDQVYERLDVHFDEVLGESTYDPMLAGVVDDLLARGIATEDEGAVIVRFTQEDAPSLKDAVLVLRKRDGAATYGLTDVATLCYRQARWSADRIIYVTDVRQSQHFTQLFAIARKLQITAELSHVGFGMLKLDGQVASSRKGGTIALIDLIDEAVARAASVVSAREDADIDEATAAEIAESVGISAIKFADLSQNPASDVNFSFERALALQGDTAPYVLYAHARAQAILRRAGQEGAALPQRVGLTEPAERELVLTLLALADQVPLAARLNRPSVIASYLLQLATAFTRFYDACPILAADVEAQTRADRLGLVRVTTAVFQQGFTYLGLRAPPKM